MAVLTQEMKTKIQELFPRYPNKQALTLPALHLVNEVRHCVPPEAVAEIAELLELAPAEIMDTMSFYGIFQPEPHGKLRCWVCRSLSCAIRGSEDLLQETFLRLWKTLPAFEPRAPLPHYLYRVARNIWIDHTRLKKNREQPTQQDLIESQIEEKGTYKDGKQEGYWESYDENGQSGEFSGTYKDGKKISD